MNSRLLTIAATGHRPNKLGGYSPAVNDVLRALALAYLHKHQPKSVISGMAQGWDMAVAEAAAEAGIPFTAAVPFAGQERRWPPEQQKRYRVLLEFAVRVHYPDPGGYAPWKYQTRNIWMVDNCDRMVALWNGSRGGTANCIAYAVRVKRPVDNLWKFWQQQRRIG